MLRAWIASFLLVSLLIPRASIALVADRTQGPGEAYADGLPAQLETLLPVVKLTVESDYYGARFLIEELLKRGGWTTAAQYDIALSVEVKTEALSQEYSPFGIGKGALYYTGARVTGTLLLEAPNRPTSEGKFSGIVRPPPRISGPSGRTRPSDAPFAQAFQASDFYKVFGRAVGKTLGPKFAVTYWSGFMDVPDRAVAAAGALGELGAAAIDPILDGVRHGHIKMAVASVALADIGDVERLFTAINDSDSRVRACVIEMLGLVSERSGSIDAMAISAVEKALADDPDATVRKAAAEALGNSRRVTAVAALQRSLKVDKDAHVRLGALLSISKLDKSEVASLIAALQDLDKDVRESAAEGLARTGDQSSVGPLIAAMQGQPISTRRVIAGVLKKMTDEDLGLDHQAWSTWWDEDKRAEHRIWLATHPLRLVLTARKPCTIDLDTGDEHKHGIVAAGDNVFCNAKDSVTVLVSEPQCWDIFVNGVQTVVEFGKSDNSKYPYAAVITSRRPASH
jgi:hypothetical protein